MENLVRDREAGVYKFTEGGKPYIYPSVTEVLHLLRRLAGEWDADDDDLQRGQFVHKCCALLDGGLDGSGLAWDTVDSSLYGYLESWERFKKDMGDALFSLGMIDIKSGVSLSCTEGPQTAAYLYAYKETWNAVPAGLIEHPLCSHKYRFAGTPDRVWITTHKKIRRFSVHLQKDGSPAKVREWTDQAEDFSVFLACLQLWNYLQKKGGKNG